MAAPSLRYLGTIVVHKRRLHAHLQAAGKGTDVKTRMTENALPLPEDDSSAAAALPPMNA